MKKLLVNIAAHTNLDFSDLICISYFIAIFGALLLGVSCLFFDHQQMTAGIISGIFSALFVLIGLFSFAFNQDLETAEYFDKLPQKFKNKLDRKNTK